METVLGLIALGFSFAALICWELADRWEIKKERRARRVTLLAIVFMFIAGFTFCSLMGPPNFRLSMAGGVLCAVGIAYAMWWTSYMHRTTARQLEQLRAIQKQQEQQGK